MSTSVPAVESPYMRVLPRSDVRLILAAAISGSAAAALAAPALWFSTAAVVALLTFASRRTRTMVSDDTGLRHLPPRLQRIIQKTMGELPAGEAKALLNDLTCHASNLCVARESTFDADWDRNTRRNVAELVEAACGVALDVARLDLALAPDRDGRLADGLIATRQLFIGRLRDAVAALAALYAAGVENGTPASHRVGELVSEIKTDAALTSHARKELEELLRSR